MLGAIIGSISFTGSVIAFVKLQEMISGGRITIANTRRSTPLLGVGIVVGRILDLVHRARRAGDQGAALAHLRRRARRSACW